MRQITNRGENLKNLRTTEEQPDRNKKRKKRWRKKKKFGTFVDRSIGFTKESRGEGNDGGRLYLRFSRRLPWWKTVPLVGTPIGEREEVEDL